MYQYIHRSLYIFLSCVYICTYICVTVSSRGYLCPLVELLPNRFCVPHSAFCTHTGSCSMEPLVHCTVQAWDLAPLERTFPVQGGLFIDFFGSASFLYIVHVHSALSMGEDCEAWTKRTSLSVMCICLVVSSFSYQFTTPTTTVSFSLFSRRQRTQQTADANTLLGRCLSRCW